MAAYDDFRSSLQAYADASGSPDLQHGFGTPGLTIMLRGESVPTGVSYTIPGFVDGIATAIDAVLGGRRAYGAVGTVTAIPGSNLSVVGNDAVHLALVAPGNLDYLTDGAIGQLFVLLWDNANATVRTIGNIVLASGASFTGAAGDSLTLLWAGGQWFEIARAV